MKTIVNLKSKKMLAILLIVVIINLTPAFAVKMDQVANEAQQYNEESKKKMGFFKKISFMSKGYRLINKAEKARDGSSTGKKESSSGNKYDEMWVQDKLSKIQQKKLLNFRNSEKNVLIASESGVCFINNTNGTNCTNNTGNKTSNSTFVIPDTCHTDAQNMILSLKEKGIRAYKLVQTQINPITLEGTIVQIIDENGRIRYAYVDAFSLESKQVELLTDENKKLVMSLDDFKKAYTGIELHISSKQDPKVVMSKIIEIQKKTIETEKNDSEVAKDEATNSSIINGILIGVGLLLVVVGVLIAMYFGRAIINEQAARAGNIRAHINDPVAWSRQKWDLPPETFTDEWATNQARGIFKDCFAAKANFNYIMEIFATMELL